MSKRVTGVVKLVLVAAMMWFVFTLIDFEDRLVTLDGQSVVAEQVVEIVGDWRADPLQILQDGEEREQPASVQQPDGRKVDVQIGRAHV